MYKKVAEELQIPQEVVQEAYYSFWRFIRDKINELPLKEDLTEEEFNSLRTNFNIPSLGKLTCTYEEYCNAKKRLQYIKLNKDKYNEQK